MLKTDATENTEAALNSAKRNRGSASDTSDLTPDRVLGDKFRIKREIGEGGMGSVYLAEDKHIGRQVAIKLIRFPKATDPDMKEHLIERFRREARAAGSVDHPNVVRIYAFEEHERRHLQIMEYVDGRTLLEELKSGPVMPEKVVRWAIEILGGLEAIHKAKLIHRDLKPQNLMLTADGHIKILDLGLAKLTDEDLSHELTQIGHTMGTPTYMSPEQIDGDADHRTDLYALGVVLFLLLTGKPPFSGTRAEIFQKHRGEPVPEIVSPHGPVDETLQAVIRKAMAKKPEARYATAEEMRGAIWTVRFAQRTSNARIKRPSPPPVPLSRLIKLSEKASPKASPKKSGRLLPTVAFAVAVGIVVVALIGWQIFASDVSVPPVLATPVEPVSEPVAAPPPNPVETPSAEATVADGCKALEAGRPSEALTILKKIVSAKPGDASARYCLCGAEHLLKTPEARTDCEAYLRDPNREKTKALQVRMWIKGS